MKTPRMLRMAVAGLAFGGSATVVVVKAGGPTCLDADIAKVAAPVQDYLNLCTQASGFALPLAKTWPTPEQLTTLQTNELCQKSLRIVRETTPTCYVPLASGELVEYRAFLSKLIGPDANTNGLVLTTVDGKSATGGSDLPPMTSSTTSTTIAIAAPLVPLPQCTTSDFTQLPDTLSGTLKRCSDLSGFPLPLFDAFPSKEQLTALVKDQECAQALKKLADSAPPCSVTWYGSTDVPYADLVRKVIAAVNPPPPELYLPAVSNPVSPLPKCTPEAFTDIATNLGPDIAVCTKVTGLSFPLLTAWPTPEQFTALGKDTKCIGLVKQLDGVAPTCDLVFADGSVVPYRAVLGKLLASVGVDTPAVGPLPPVQVDPVPKCSKEAFTDVSTKLAPDIAVCTKVTGLSFPLLTAWPSREQWKALLSDSKCIGLVKQLYYAAPKCDIVFDDGSVVPYHFMLDKLVGGVAASGGAASDTSSSTTTTTTVTNVARALPTCDGTMFGNFPASAITSAEKCAKLSGISWPLVTSLPTTQAQWDTVTRDAVCQDMIKQVYPIAPECNLKLTDGATVRYRDLLQKVMGDELRKTMLVSVAVSAPASAGAATGGDAATTATTKSADTATDAVEDAKVSKTASSSSGQSTTTAAVVTTSTLAASAATTPAATTSRVVVMAVAVPTAMVTLSSLVL